jgi:hypothetical protein
MTELQPRLTLPEGSGSLSGNEGGGVGQLVASADGCRVDGQRGKTMRRLLMVLGAALICVSSLTVGTASAAPNREHNTTTWKPLKVSVVSVGTATVIVCSIDNASWALTGQWQVSTSLGAMHCSTPVRHQEESKTVIKAFIGWSDQQVRKITLPTTGYGFTEPLWNVNLPIRSTDTGTYHIHLKDLATAQSGSQALLIDADGANFYCKPTGCSYTN